jgi:hypothetical protein
VQTLEEEGTGEAVGRAKGKKKLEVKMVGYFIHGNRTYEVLREALFFNFMRSCMDLATGRPNPVSGILAEIVGFVTKSNF